MAKSHKHDRHETPERKPHHHHALTKASAVHLFNSGHIDEGLHDDIVKHAERGMKKAKAHRD